MNIRVIPVLVAGLALAIAPTPAAHAQTLARPIMKPHGTLLQKYVVAKDVVAKDVVAQAATVTAPSLRAVMPTNPAVRASAWLYFPFLIKDGGDTHSVTLMPPSSSTQGSYVWFDVSGAPAGHYHVRFTFLHINGTTGTTGVSIHSGRTPSGPVIATCTVSSAAQSCDAVVSAPGGGVLDLTASLDSGVGLLFDSVYIAPTVLPGS